MSTSDTQDLVLAEPRVIEGDNPFGVDPEADFLAEPRHEIESWSETMFFLVWSPEQGVGIWLHTGVVPQDKTLWWAQTFALLPDGKVLVDRSYGRRGDRSGPTTGNLTIRQAEPGKRWTLSFDGAGEVSSTEKLATGPAGAGPAEPFRFEVDLQALVPVYDLHAAIGVPSNWEMGGIHYEQGFTATGQLHTLDGSYELDGIAVRDHSRGERDFTNFGGHAWNYIVWPDSGRAMCAFSMWRPGTQSVNTTAVVIFEHGRAEVCNDFSITGSSSAGGFPRELELSVVRQDGSRLDLTGEVVHNVTMTYAVPNHNLNGCWAPDHGLDDPVVADESVVRWTAPDGEVGYGNFERGFRHSNLPYARIPLPPTSSFASKD